MTTAKEIAAELCALLDERRSVEECRHAEHHRFIATLIEREERRSAMYEDLRRHLAKWGAVGLLSFVGMACWYWLRNHIS